MYIKFSKLQRLIISIQKSDLYQCPVATSRGEKPRSTLDKKGLSPEVENLAEITVLAPRLKPDLEPISEDNVEDV